MEKVKVIKSKAAQKAQKAQSQAQKHAGGFLEFIREQGVVTLAVGFILAAAVTKTVNSLVIDIINPLLGIVLGKTNISTAGWQIAGVTVAWGNFVSSLIDFTVIAFVVYIGFKVLKLDRLDIDTKKREKEAEKLAELETKTNKNTKNTSTTKTSKTL